MTILLLLLLALPCPHCKVKVAPVVKPFDLFDAGGNVILSCVSDEIGNISDCGLVGEPHKALDAVGQRMWDAAHANPKMATMKLVMFREKL